MFTIPAYRLNSCKTDIGPMLTSGRATHQLKTLARAYAKPLRTNTAVYSLYDLTPDEITLIENS